VFNKTGKNNWKLEYEDTFYKVYDWNNKLAGYFFPQYNVGNSPEVEEDDDDTIHQLNKDKIELTEGTLVVPMLKLNILDSEQAMPIEAVISNLESGRIRAAKWADWLRKYSDSLSIYGVGVHTAREDRNMLSIAIGMRGKLILGEKGVRDFLSPLLDLLHSEGLL
jgi:hypothetical protein